MPSRLSHYAATAFAAMLTATVCLSVPDLAAGQAASDYYAYPSAFVGDISKYRSDPRQLTFNRMPGLSQDYRLGVGDEIEVLTVGVGSQQYKVDSRGDITLPYYGTVRVVDLNAEEAESAIAAALAAKQLIKDPQVLVSVVSYESKVVYALGEFDKPGEYAVSFQMTLMDLVFLAGGIDGTATRYAYFHRRNPDAASEWRPLTAGAELEGLKMNPQKPRNGSEVIQIDLQPLKRGGVLERNYALRDGDLFYIPRRKLEFVYLMGEVNQPGAFEIPPREPATASKAIAWAGGPMKTAHVSKGTILRQDAAGVRHEIPVDFLAILNGDKPDVELQPNDIVFVPGSGAKRFATGMLTTLTRMATFLLVF